MSKKIVAVLALSAASSLAQAGGYCYTLLDRAGRMVSQSATSPVDLSRRISDALAERYPGHHLVFGLADSCPEVAAPVAAGAARSGAARAASVAALLSRYPDIGQRSDGAAVREGEARAGYAAPTAAGAYRGVAVGGGTGADGMSADGPAPVTRGRARRGH